MAIKDLKISVVIPLYNKELSIRDTVTSVLNQTYRNFELLIVNDGSKDESLSMVKTFTDDRIRIFDSKNKGVSSARNIGISNSKYEYIAFLDGDDIWSKFHLEILVNGIFELDTYEVGGFATSFYKSNCKKFDYDKLVLSSATRIDNYFSFMSTPYPRFNSSTIVVKKEKLTSSGLFNESFSYGEDVDFWYRLFSKHNLVYIDTITTIYFVAAENRSTQHLTPLHSRFHKFVYHDKSSSEKRYLDKLVALLLIDYGSKGAYEDVKLILTKYYMRIPGVFIYLFLLARRKCLSR